MRFHKSEQIRWVETHHVTQTQCHERGGLDGDLRGSVTRRYPENRVVFNKTVNETPFVLDPNNDVVDVLDPFIVDVGPYCKCDQKHCGSSARNDIKLDMLI